MSQELAARDVRTPRRVPAVIALLSLTAIGNGISYWAFGPARTLDLVAKVFAITYPTLPDGTTSVPAIPVLKGTYVAHPVGIGLHYVFMPLVLVAALLQFWPCLRAARPALHRWLGRAFFACLVLGVGGAVLKIVQGDLYGGTLSRVQFGGMAITTLVCATLGGVAARRRDFAAHEVWMWRTYLVVWSSAVMSRFAILLVVPIIWRWMGARPEDFPLPYNAVLALSWSLPLLFTRAAPRVADRGVLGRAAAQG